MTSGMALFHCAFSSSSLLEAGSILKVIALQRGNFAAVEEVVLEELQVFKVQ